ncbi:hypothetical protein FOZ60_004826 [Perkinsus olseni]|uniref:Uncharacterized protein n=1 Tax=Perkinsus olseni TaxID=32597 RepID=A0A7J6NS92_PEROL|nr:hypothetical protein FOZ60_004826 [Perkinsus olseni]
MVVRALSDTSSYTIALTSFTVVVVATAAIAGVLIETPSDTSRPSRAITSIIIGTLVASATCHISVALLMPTIAVGVPEVGLFVQCCLVSSGGILSWALRRRIFFKNQVRRGREPP